MKTKIIVALMIFATYTLPALADMSAMAPLH